jgi:pimeloyl-ACP methyl ester carboxylesterase
MPKRVSTINVRGLSLAFCDSEGPGHPVVLLHGSSLSKEVFARQFNSELLRRYRLIAVDLPGHGASDDAPDASQTYTLRGFAAITREFLEALGITRATLVGWSLGAHVALELMATSDLAAGVMITGAPPIALGPFGLLRGFCAHWDVLLTSKEHFTERDEARFLALCFGEAEPTPFREALHRADGRVRSNFVRSILRGEGADEARAVEIGQVPVAVVNGADEPIARLGYVAGLAYGNLWRDQCHVIPDAGHSPFWQRPYLYNGLLHDFVEDVMRSEAATRDLRTAGFTAS